MAVPRALEPAGMMLVDKPAGPSSFQVIRQIRDETGARTGHAGTLDPLASGLLLVLLGAATRLARYLVGLDKRYLTEIDLSARTTSGDTEGERIEEHEPPGRPGLESLLDGLRGEVELRLPRLSAVKVGGERAYRLARSGNMPDMPLRTSQIYESRLLGYDDGVVLLDLLVGSGTYVRSIADALGGHCRTLRRLEVGPFLVEDAGERILPPVEALSFLPGVDLTDENAALVRNGRTVTLPAPSEAKPGFAGQRDPAVGGGASLRLLYKGRLLAVARVAAGTVHPETVMPA